MTRRRWLLILGLVLAGVALRVWIFRTPQGALNADESFTGLQAMEIVRGDLPVVFEGQAYTAVPESYLFAPIVWIFGAPVVALKLLSSLLWAVVAVLVHRQSRSIVGSNWAIVAAAFMWLAPGASMVMSVRAYEGYASGMLVVFLAVVASRRLLRGDHPTVRSSALVGALLGLAVYVHPMFVAVAAPVAAVPAWTYRRQVRTWWVPASLGAIATNVPFLAWNALNDWDSLDQASAGVDSLITRLGRFFTDLMPRALGLRDFDGDWTLGRTLGPLLAILVLGLVIVGGIDLWRRGRAERVFVFPLVLAWPIMSLFGNLEYVADGRYGVIVLPFVVIAIVVGLARISRRLVRSSLLLPLVATLVWSALLVVPWARANLGDRVSDPNADVTRVVERLDEVGVKYLAGNFWWVLPVEYASDQRVRTEVVGNPYVVRLPDSHRIVQAASDSEVAFVFDASDEDLERLRLPVDRYERQEFGRAVLYVPLAVE
ncbi:MAG: hypothetical protein ACKOD2_15425 [Ilumatobacteraceae bacterium]